MLALWIGAEVLWTRMEALWIRLACRHRGLKNERIALISKDGCAEKKADSAPGWDKTKDSQEKAIRKKKNDGLGSMSLSVRHSF